ncbi:MAG: hypothetical protein AB1629_06010 [Candidatus Omnitrophota bacterium]
MYSKRLNNNKGFIMILTYLLIVVLFLLGVAFFSRSASEKKISSVDKDNVLAFDAAEAGLNRSIIYLRANTPSPSLDAPFDPFSGAQTLCAEPSLTNCTNTTTAKATYLITIDPSDDNDQHPTSSKFTITSKGTSGQLSRTVTTVVQTDNFARFAYFSDTEHYGVGWWRTPVWFITSDSIWGPSHTNGHYHISGSPSFYDVAASGDDFVTYYHGGPPIDAPSVGGFVAIMDDNGNIIDGFTKGATPIPMPNQAIELHNAAVQGGQVYNGDTTVVLNSNGTMNVTNTQANCNPCNNVALPTNHALYVSGGNLTVSGTLNGSLTVGSNRNIIIPDNVRYNTLPSGSTFCPEGNTIANDGTGRQCLANATDMLGVIAEKEVVVSSSAPSNLEIDASIMAMDRSFSVQNWNTVAPKGTLKVFGGIIQDQRGPVGTFNSSTNTVQTGYSKSYIYDSRFTTAPPLYFPQTGDYLNLVWQEDLGL